MARKTSKGSTSASCICHICSKKLSRPTQLKRHLDTHNIQSKNRFPCPFENCAFSGRQKSNLKVHIKTIHDGTKDVFCPFCDYKTTNRSSLLHHHARFHPGVEPRSVSECTSSSSRSRSSSSSETSSDKEHEPSNTFFNSQYFPPPPSQVMLPATQELSVLMQRFDWDWYNSITQSSLVDAQSDWSQEAGTQDSKTFSPDYPFTYTPPYSPPSSPDCGLHFAPPSPPTFYYDYELPSCAAWDFQQI